jgi:hypothetical protein
VRRGVVRGRRSRGKGVLALRTWLCILLGATAVAARADLEDEIQVTRSVNDWAALGLEYYLDLGQVTRLLPYAQQAHMLFIAADIDRKPWAFNFGIGRGFGDDTDRWTVKAIIEVPDS